MDLSRIPLVNLFVKKQTASVIIAERCNYCSDFYNPNELRTMGESIKICWKCAEKQTVQVEAFNPPDHCQVCHRPTAELAAEEPGDYLHMFPHWKDGVYQLLCRRCDAAYLPKRRDLVRGTRFAEEQKLL